VADVAYGAAQLSAAVEAEVLRFDTLADSQFIENVSAACSLFRASRARSGCTRTTTRW